jgi:hypothetical protein
MVAAVNRKLQELGETPRLRAGRGYYYFDGVACGWPASSVYVYRSNELTLSEWLAEYNQLKLAAEQWGRATK